MKRHCETSREVATTFERAATLDYGEALAGFLRPLRDGTFRARRAFPRFPARHTFA